MILHYNLSSGQNLSTFLIDQGYAIKENPSTKPQIKQDISELFVRINHLSCGFNLFFYSVPFVLFLRFFIDCLI